MCIICVRHQANPWLNNSNVNVMNTAFGSSGWILGTFQNTSAATVFNASTKVVFMDGSNMGATALSNYLTSNTSTIENWVSNGGMLWINAAPDQGGNFGLGFGGVTLNFNINYNKASNNASISSGQNSHSIFTGPNACGTTWTGLSFAHATITGGSATALITGNKGTVLAEKTSGYGRVLFGTMTLASFHSPQPQATNLRLNILSYLNNNAPFVIQCNSTNATCVGNNNGSASVNIVVGGSAPFTYQWNTGSVAQTLNNRAPGTYTVTVTDAAGRTATCSSVVAVNPAPTITVNGSTTICPGDSVALTCTNGSNYLWSTGATTQSIYVQSAGNYTVELTSAGCVQITAPVSISFYTQPNISLNGPSNICPGNTVTLTATASDSYLWSNGATNQSINVNSTGNYTVTVTNTSGCSQTKSQNITVQPLPTPNISVAGNTTVCPGSTLTLNSSTAHSYLWSNGATTNSVQVNTAGNYTVTISDALGCTAQSAPFTVSTPSGNPTIFGTNQWLVYAFNNGSNQYQSNLWSAAYAGYYSDNTISFNTQSRWTLTTSPSNASGFVGCTVPVDNHSWSAKRQGFVCGYYQIDIPEHNAVIELLIDNVQIFVHTGSGVTHNNVWSGYLNNNSKIEIRGSISTGDSYGSIVLTKLTSNIALITNTWHGNTLCAGQSATLVAPANAANYLWSTGATSSSISVSTSGSYTVTVTDASGCSVTSSPISITAKTNAAPTPSINATPASPICQGSSIDLTTSISYPGYLWSNGITSNKAVVDQTGNYSVIVTATTACKAVAFKNITVVNMPTPTIVANQNPFCAGNIVNLDAGSFSNYMWNTGATTQTINTTTESTYTVTVTTGPGCTGSSSISIIQRALPNATATATPSNIFNGNNSQFTAGPLTATGPTYMVNNIPFSMITDSGTTLTLGDDELSTAIPIGFNFNFYGAPQSQIYISSNGFITFDANSGSGCCIGQNLPDIAIPNAVIAAGWSDLDPATGGTISYVTTGVSPNRKCAITYTAIPNFGGGLPETFQIVLCENQNIIELHLSTLSTNVGLRTAGIENFSGVDATVIPGKNSSSTWGANQEGWRFSLVPENSFTWTPSTGLNSASVYNPIASPSTSTNYTVTVTDFYGCSKTASLGLVVSPNPSPIINGNTPFCDQDSIYLSVANGYVNYLWSNGKTTSGIYVKNAATYTITVTNLNSSTGTASVTTTVNALPNVSITGNTVICQSSSTTLEASAGLSSYLWSNGSTNQSITALQATVYTVTVSNTNGCTKSATATTTISASPQPIISGNVNFCVGQSTTLSTTGYSSYLWSDGETTNAINVNAAGTYMVTVTNTDGCSGSGSITVNDPVVITAAINGVMPTCNGLNNGALTATVSGGMAPFYYLWNTGATTAQISGAIASTYTVTITGSFGCSATATMLLNQPLLLQITENLNHITCHNANNGAIQTTISGGTSPYTYLWSNGSTNNSVQNLSPGNYTLTVVDFNGCIVLKTFSINQPDLLTGTASSTPTSCTQNTGTAQANVSGGTMPYSYLWSNGGTVSPISQIGTGIYTVTVTDFNGCSLTANTMVSAQNAPVQSLTGTTAPSCFGYNNGAIQTTVTGGTAPFNYAWNPAQPDSNNIYGLTSGTYQCIVTDASGCASIQQFILQQPDSLHLNVSTTSVTSIGGNNGTATAVSNGGSLPYAYLWSNGSTNVSINNLSAGTYTVTVTDVNGCSKSASAVLSSYPTLIASVNTTSILCNGGSSNVTISAQGGSGVYIGTGSFTYTAGTYVVVVYDDAGNSDSVSFSLTEPAAININASFTAINCFGGNSTVTINAMGGTGAISGTGNYVVQAGTHNYMVTDANGCTSTITLTIDQPQAFIANATSNAIVCYGGSEDILISATGGTPPYTGTGVYLRPAGIYTFVVTDATGCTASTTYQLTQPNAFIASATSTDILCNGGYSIISVTSSGGTLPVSGVGNFAVTAGTYTYTLTDNGGCTATTSIIVSEPNPLTINVTQANAACSGNNVTVTISADGGTPPFTGTGLINRTPGTYTATVTDVNGCSASLTYTVSTPQHLSAVLSKTPILCKNGTSNITVAAIGGVPPYTGVGIFSVNAGTYTYTVTDSKGCTASSTTTVTEPTLLSANAVITTPIACYGATGIATVSGSGGTPPYTGTGAKTIVDGLNTFIITDANGCTATANVSATQPNQMVITTTTFDHVKCFGQSNGKIIVSITAGNGGQTYQWSNGNTTKTNNNLAPGTYSFTVTDGIGCTSQSTYTITQPPLLTTTISGTNVSCFNGTNGTASIVANGGVPPYIYLWNNSATTSTNAGLTDGTKNVTVTDANGCNSSNSIELTHPTKLDYGVGNTSTNVNCNGESTGTATVVIVGGVTPYTYLWNTSVAQTNNVATNLSAGTYTVTVTDANNCTITRSYIITEPTQLTGNITTVNVACNGGSNGSVTANPTGGAGPYSYSWSNGITSKVNNTIPIGTYTVTVTDNKGCTITISSTVTSPNLIAHNETISTINCNGATGSITINASGGITPYTYAWNGGNTSATRNNLTANTYTCTITDANGCTKSKIITLTQPPILTSNANQSNITCNGMANGIAGGIAAGGTPPYNYVWNNGSTSAIRNNLNTGNYTITITDSKGCTVTRSYNITQPAVLSNSTTSSSVSCYNGSNGTVTSNPSGGTTPYVYIWSNGSTIKNPVNVSAGTYTVTATDAKGCTATSSITLTAPTLINNASTITQTTCTGCSNGAISLTTTNGNPAYNYLWNGGTTTKNRNALSNGTYTVTTTDSKGCTITNRYIITTSGHLNASLTYTNPACGGSNTGSISTSVNGGTTPYTYLWNTGHTTANRNNISAGTYTVTVTDGAGTTRVLIQTLIAPNAITLSLVSNPVSCNGGNNGFVSAAAYNGTPPYSYAWNTGSNNSLLNNRSTGTYTVTVTDGNNCTMSASASVTQPSILSISKTITNVTCNGLSNGTITNTITGGNTPYIYQWNNGQLTANATNLNVGNYTITVTDAKGCTTTSSSAITQPALLSNTITTVNVPCFGTNNGSATANATGGSTPYTYSWNTVPVKTTASATGLTIGTYTVTITDNNGCTSTGSTTLTQPTLLTTNISGVNLTCNGSNNGSASVVVSGGSTPYNYLWNTGATSSAITNRSAGTYTVTVTDNKGCTSLQSITLTQPTAIIINATTTNISCAGNNNGSISLNVSGGASPYTYLWNGGNTNSTRTNLAANNYTVTVTDATGCTKTSVVTVGSVTAINISLTPTPTGCTITNNGSIQSIVTGGTAPFTYLWNTNPTLTTANINGLSAGSYTITVTDINGCTKTASTTITTPTNLSGNLIGNNVSCYSGSNGSVSVNIITGTAPFNFLWSNGITNQNITNLVAGTYTVTVSDVNGCSTTLTQTLTSPAILVAGLTKTNILCSGQTNGTISLNPTGGVGPYSYLWNTGNSTSTLSNLSAGLYTCTVTDANNCTVSASANIVSPETLTLATTSQNALCNGTATGSITSQVAGGTPPFTYVWSNSSTTANQNNLFTGTYTVTVTDGSGCTATSVATVNQPVALALNFITNDVTCAGLNNGEATAQPTNGVQPYSYFWSNGCTTKVNALIPGGTYTVTITDANGCTITGSTLVTEYLPLTISTTSVTSVSCFGGSNGGVVCTATGGKNPYTYLWSNGVTTKAYTSFAAGTYTITATDNKGCITQETYIIIEPAQLTTSISVTDVTPPGNNGTATVTVNGGTPPYSYAWNTIPVQTTAVINNLIAGIYTATVTDANGCTTTNVATVQSACTLTVQLSGTDVSCFGGNNGSINSTIIGGVSPYNYYWNDGNTTSQLSGLTAGTYTLTVTDLNNCIGAATLTITSPSALNLSLVSNNVSCFGIADGSCQANANGGTTPYTYLWNSGQTTQNINQLSAGNYTTTVTDANGCTVSNTTTVIEPLLLNVNINIQQPLCSNASGALTANVSGGTLSYQYLWSNSQTTASISVSAGTYTVTVTDFNGCTATASAGFEAPAALALTMSSNDVTCAGSFDGTATAQPSNGILPYTYLWSNGNTNKINTNLSGGTYTVTVTDSNGCTISDNVFVTEYLPLNLQTTGLLNVACYGGNDGYISTDAIGGKNPYTYLWSNGVTTKTFSNFSEGAYILTVTDNKGCTYSQAYYISQPDSISITFNTSNVTSIGANDGTAKANVSGGTGPYSYTWNTVPPSANDSVSGLAPGTYCVTITDVSGCTGAACITINEACGLSVNANVTSASCFNNNDGAASLNISGGQSPYTYLWSNGNTTSSLNGVTAGSYNVTVTDANNCTDAETVIITQPQALQISNSNTNVSCNGGSNGSISLNISGGTSPYSYLWSNGSTNVTISTLSAGTYMVTVTDANACTATKDIIVTEPALLTASNIKTNVSCLGAATGSITTTVNGGTTPYTYVWSNGTTLSNATNLIAGNYTVTVTDQNGCTVTTSNNITQPGTGMSLTVTNNDVTCNGLANGKATANASNGATPYTYLWNNGSTNKVNNLVPGGTYTVTVTDANGCTITGSTVVVEYAPLGLNTTLHQNVSCNGGGNGAVTTTGTGGKSPYSYVWNNGSTNKSRTGMLAGNYTLTVTDNKGCTYVQTFTITQPAILNASTSTTNASNASAFDGSATAIVSGGTTPYAYSWNTTPLQTNSTANNLQVGAYIVTISDANGCTYTSVANVTSGCALTLSMNQTNITCNGQNNGTATVTANGTSPYTYVWNNGNTASNLSNLANGIYTVTVTDANSCTASISVTITQPDVLTINQNKTNVSCNGGSNGSISLNMSGGTSPYSYLWSNGSTNVTISTLSAGTYMVTVTDANACTATKDIIVTEPALLTASNIKTNVSCLGAATGSITTTVNGGTTPYTYVWSNGTTLSNATNLIAGNYTVTVTDENGCTVTTSNNITQPGTGMSLTVTNNDVTCNGLANGKATANASNGATPYTYLWNNGSTNKVNNLVPGGTYTVTVTDANGCTITGSTVVVEYAPLGLNTTLHQNVSCNGGGNGAVTTTGTGGKSPYSYVWNNGSTNKSRTGMLAGNYTLTVTDNKGCTYVQTFTITQPAILTIATTKTNVSVNGGNDGSATATPSGGSVPYSYSWNTTPAKTTATATGLIAGTYTVTVSDANNCTATKSVTITQPGARLINTIPSIFNLEIYPNPANDVVQIRFNETINKNVMFKMYTQYGSLVYENVAIVDESITIDLSALSKAIYNLHIEFEGQRIVKRIVLQ
jgi:hypothetical protein